MRMHPKKFTFTSCCCCCWCSLLADTLSWVTTTPASFYYNFFLSLSHSRNDVASIVMSEELICGVHQFVVLCTRPCCSVLFGLLKKNPISSVLICTDLGCVAINLRRHKSNTKIIYRTRSSKKKEREIITKRLFIIISWKDYLMTLHTIVSILW